MMTDKKSIDQAIAEGEMIERLKEEIRQEIREPDVQESLVFLEMGRIQMGNATANFMTATALGKIQQIKESKSYKLIKGRSFPTPDGEMVCDGTWEMFCKLIGSSKRSVDEKLQNLNEFGTAALGAMESAGIGVRQMRALRTLPDDERTALIENVEVNVGDKDAIVDLVTEIVTKKEAEKTELEKQAEEAKKELDAQKKVSKKKNETIDKLEAQLVAKEAEGLPAQIKELTQSIDVQKIGALSELYKLEQVYQRAESHAAEHTDHRVDDSIQRAMLDTLCQIRDKAEHLMSQFQLDEAALDIDDSWMQKSPTDNGENHDDKD